MKSLNEEDGIKAIQFLQGTVNLKETKVQARAGWNGMSESERRMTMEVYEMLKAKEPNKPIQPTQKTRVHCINPP